MQLHVVSYFIFIGTGFSQKKACQKECMRMRRRELCIMRMRAFCVLGIRKRAGSALARKCHTFFIDHLHERQRACLKELQSSSDGSVAREN